MKTKHSKKPPVSRIKDKKKISKIKGNKLKPNFKKSPQMKLKKKKDFAAMSVDEFLNQDYDQPDDVMDEEISEETAEHVNGSEIIEDEEADFGNISENDSDDGKSHKESLAKLKEIDPEFYKFLEENDQKLLQFNVSDSEQEDDDEEVHKPTGELDVASDESDFEPDQEDAKDKVQEQGKNRVITLRMLKSWRNDLHTDKSNKTITCLVNAFHAALLRVSNEEDEVALYKVDGSSVFNAVIQLCVLELGPAIRKFLGLVHGSKLPPHKCKKFVKVKTLLRCYFTDLLKLLGGVTSTNILNVLLKHLHYMSPLLVSFPNLSKPTIKRLVQLWGTSDENVRVIAFLCILRITNGQQTLLLDTVLKSMYMTYVKNSKFVSSNTLPGINFMRRSLVEMYALDVNVSYQHVFLYIRQLAIHLRNAITVHKKESIQAVYNWQFVNSLRLWGNLLSVTCNKPQLQPLTYPFVQVCLGTIKLMPTTQYYPLRFHVVQILMDLTRETGVFVPVLSFLLEVLNGYDFDKKHKKVSMKPLSLTCLLRLSKSQLTENGFKNAVIENIYDQLLEYLASQSHSIAFPDLSLFCVLQIKAFVKKCHVSNYCKKMKQILEKIEQNNQFIENERKKVSFAIYDFKQIAGWETTIRNKGTPLSTFYESWNKLRTIKKNKQVTENDKLGEYNLPVIKRVKKDVKVNGNEPANPFPSDSDSDDDINFEDKREKTSKKRKRGKRGGKNLNAKTSVNAIDVEPLQDDEDDKDIVEDLKMSEW